MKKCALTILLLMTIVAILTACKENNPPVETTDGSVSVTDPGGTDTEASEPESATGKESESMTESEQETLPPFEPVTLSASNVAREGYAVASSSKYDGGYSNLYLNDGDLSRGFTTWWNQQKDPAAPHYILIDLAGTQTVEAVRLYPLAGDEKGFPIDFDIMVSNDNEAYTTVAVVDGASAEQAKDGLVVPFDPVQAAYVKLVTRQVGMGDGEKGAYLSLAEFEVMAAVDTGTNMILNRQDIWLFKNPDTTQQLEILYYRDGRAIDPETKLYYSSENPSVAAVDETGLITPVSVGETVIYVRDGVNRAACKVEVKEEPIHDYRLTTFYHSCFGSPETYVKGLRILKDAGIEYVEDTRFADSVGNNITMYMIYLCDKMGLAYSVCDQEGGEGGFLSMTKEEIIAIVQKYENRAGIYGIYLRDEPHEEFAKYALVHRIIQEYNPHLTPHLNLLPPYNFGGTEEYYTEYAAVAGGARRMQYLSFDYYPFRWGDWFDTRMYEVLEMIRTTGLRYNADTGYYMQSMIITGAYPLLYERELRYNASIGMAYGIKNFKWFVALTPVNAGEAFQTGLVGPDFEPADNYVDIVATNQYIKNLGRYLGDYDAIEVYHTSADTGAVLVPDTFLLQPVGAQNAIYSLYRANDGSNRQHILITNKDYKIANPVEFNLRLNESIGAISLYDPLTDQTTALTVGDDGSFSVTLMPGASALILLPEGVEATTPIEANENLAFGKAVFASTSSAKFWEDGNIGTHFLTDGVRENGYWLSDRDEREGWLLVDLGQAYKISSLHIYNHRNLAARFGRDFTVYVSEDGVNFTEVAVMTDAKPSGYDTPCVCTFDSIRARYIRIQINNSGTRGGFGFGEIEVYA